MKFLKQNCQSFIKNGKPEQYKDKNKRNTEKQDYEMQDMRL